MRPAPAAAAAGSWSQRPPDTERDGPRAPAGEAPPPSPRPNAPAVAPARAPRPRASLGAPRARSFPSAAHSLQPDPAPPPPSRPGRAARESRPRAAWAAPAPRRRAAAEPSRRRSRVRGAAGLGAVVGRTPGVPAALRPAGLLLRLTARAGRGPGAPQGRDWASGALGSLFGVAVRARVGCGRAWWFRRPCEGERVLRAGLRVPGSP